MTRSESDRMTVNLFDSLAISSGGRSSSGDRADYRRAAQHNRTGHVVFLSYSKHRPASTTPRLHCNSHRFSLMVLRNIENTNQVFPYKRFLECLMEN